MECIKISSMSEVAAYWFRRDLRLQDNAGLYHALRNNSQVLPVFIFDTLILDKLETNDLRVQFIHQTLQKLKIQLQEWGSDLVIEYGEPLEVWKKLVKKYSIKSVYTNHDYEPYARKRDASVEKLLNEMNVAFKTFKDQVLFEKEEVLSGKGTPYTVFTPYKKKVLSLLTDDSLKPFPTKKYFSNFYKITNLKIPSLHQLGFKETSFEYPTIQSGKSFLAAYEKNRNFPAKSGTSRVGVHLRFGTVSVREMAEKAKEASDTYLSELIWRDFFMQILWHFPRVFDHAFKPDYDKIIWRKSASDLSRWQDGLTGYPLVDAGMRELNATGFMHNRVRMVAASFLIKHLLIDWRKGESYFAKTLLDYDLASNNGNWQWVAGSGCDAAPYFRIFNPMTQIKKFDPQLEYIRKWIPEFQTAKYPEPMVEHVFARERVLKAYSKALKGI